MPYQVEWMDKPYIVRVKFIGALSESELKDFADEVIALVAEVPDVLVHSLVDATELEKLPPINSLAGETRRLLAGFPNRSMSTMYGVNKLVRYMAEMLVKITPLRIRIFETQEEAETFVRQMVAAEIAGQDEAG